MAATRDSLPLGEISSSEAQVRIKFELFGPKTIKTCSGASLFVDIDGYTAAIDSLLEDEERLLDHQTLHAFGIVAAEGLKRGLRRDALAERGLFVKTRTQDVVASSHRGLVQEHRRTRYWLR